MPNLVQVDPVALLPTQAGCAVFLGILVFEVVMTRRLVQGGHEVVDTESHETEAVLT